MFCNVRLAVSVYIIPANIVRPGHRFDENTPVEETMQALHDVVKAGYVRYIGMSSCHAWQCEHPSMTT